VPDPRGGARLPQKQRLRAAVVHEGLVDDLQRDIQLQPFVVCLVRDAHRTGAQLPKHAIGMARDAVMMEMSAGRDLARLGRRRGGHGCRCGLGFTAVKRQIQRETRAKLTDSVDEPTLGANRLGNYGSVLFLSIGHTSWGSERSRGSFRQRALCHHRHEMSHFGFNLSGVEHRGGDFGVKGVAEAPAQTGNRGMHRGGV